MLLRRFSSVQAHLQDSGGRIDGVLSCLCRICLKLFTHSHLCSSFCWICSELFSGTGIYHLRAPGYQAFQYFLREAEKQGLPLKVLYLHGASAATQSSGRLGICGGPQAIAT